VAHECDKACELFGLAVLLLRLQLEDLQGGVEVPTLLTELILW
jgi:hypothetical protein